MKKASLFCLLCLVSLATHAQISITPRIGYVGKTFFSTNYAGHSSHGLSLGADANIPIWRRFSIQTGVSFNREFARTSEVDKQGDIFMDNPPSRSASVVQNSFSIPITARYTFGGERVKGYVFGGVAFNRYYERTLRPNNEEGLRLWGGAQGYYFGAQLGGGLLVKAGKGYLNFDARFSRMYRAFTDFSYDMPITFSPTVGYQFSLGKK